ncbi:MAG TPA: translation initiation factor IF-2 [Elusimicrobiales bacterium]|nr:translation initiation factor IF-2 [Elusimicrobiales bacterium]HPO94819.1 translation initiation factor IF-2 [Elusimicrobiales bacterium]
MEGKDEKTIKKISIDKITGRKKEVKVDKDKLKAFLAKKKQKEEEVKKQEKAEEKTTEKDSEQKIEPVKEETKTAKKTTSDKQIKQTQKTSAVHKTKQQEPSLKEPEVIKQKDKDIENKKTEEHKTKVKDTQTKVEERHVKSEEIEQKTEEANFVTYEIKETKSAKHQDKKKEDKTKKEEKTEEKPKTQQKSEEPKKEEKIKIEKKEGVEYKKLKVSTTLTVRDLAEKLGIKAVDLIKKLMSMGIFASITQKLEEDVAAVVSLDYGYELEFIPAFEDTVIADEDEKDDPSKLKPRSPVITIMGHVDHGKTTLLDALRQSNVVDTEAGQITQHIGAYMIRTPKGNITVLDTPGHEAFTAMRAQGVKITDIVILVVSAVDGVMPQTIEAINHAKAANVPIIVAINKIDLPQANPNNIKQQLSAHDLIPEDWGGKVPMVEISAKKKTNIDKLLEIVLLQAEIMELKANYEAKGLGVIVEAKKDSKRGIVSTVICTKGTIKIGDSFVVGTTFGKVKALVDDRGQRLKELLPSMPAELLGINEEIPVPGDVLKIVESEKKAREIAENRKQIRKDNILHQKNISLLSLKSQIEQNLIKKLNIILKTDVYGSLQAIRDSLEKFANSEVAIHILHTGIGDVNESDIALAKASNGIIFGFNIKASDEIKERAKENGVEIRIYRIIYELFEDMKAALNGMLEPEIVEVEIGKAEIKKIFDISVGKVAGSMVIEGKVARNSMVKIIRNGEVVGEGKISGLKKVKEDVKEMEKGHECGILIEGFKNFQEGDIIAAYVKEERIRRINELER